MPLVVYIFALSAFALGLAEFVPIGLADVVAQGLGVSVDQAGGVVTAYAVGATFAAPVLSALTSNWTRRRTMLITVVVFTLGSLVAAIATGIGTMLVARFVAGMGHGLFLAVASSTAAQMVGPKKAGSAVAVVFGGFTVALAAGVPLSTYLGGFAWRPVFMAIAVFGAIGGLGLALGMKEPVRSRSAEPHYSVVQALKAMFHPMLLSAALVTVLGYAGSFTAFTYIAPLLTDVTGVTPATVGAFMMIYGVLAAIGNVVGGKVADRFGSGNASMIVLAGISAVSLLMWLLASSALAMGLLIALLGMFSYAAVPALQARLMGVAQRSAPHAVGVAAGLNIAGFNSGIALGSVMGGLTLSSAGLAYMGITGAIIAAAGLGLLLVQVRRSRASEVVGTRPMRS